jgi:hypothetical protein
MALKKHLTMKRLALAAGLAVGMSGMARADDSSMSPFTGESYNAFNGGKDRMTNTNPTFDQAPSAWRRANPDGLPERVYQSYSALGLAWKLDNPVFASVASDPTFKASHPGGLSESELQALSSDAPAWQLAAAPGTPLAAQDQAAVAQNTAQEPLGDRIAQFFHVRNSVAE